MGHAACLFPARRAGTGRTEQPVNVSHPKPLASWAEKGEASDWGRTQPTIPQAPREPTRVVALPPYFLGSTSPGLRCPSAGRSNLGNQENAPGLVTYGGSRNMVYKILGWVKSQSSKLGLLRV